MRQYSTLKPYRVSVDITPLMVEFTVSILAGFFLLFWGMVLFSNVYYQHSTLTRWRNAFVSEERAAALYEHITIVTPDIDETIVLRAEEDPEYLLRFITDGLATLRDYAQELERSERVVVGVDFAITRSDFDRSLYEELAAVVGGVPENMAVVFGILLLDTPEGPISASRAFFDRLASHASPPLAGPETATRIYFGNIGTLNATVRSGLDNGNDRSIAVGYQPIVHAGSMTESQQRGYLSMPLAMLIAGEVNPASFESGPAAFALSDYATPSQPRLQTVTVFSSEDPDAPEGAIARLISRTQIAEDELYRPMYYDFRTSLDISRLARRFVWLGNFDPGAGREQNAAGEGGAEYFFLAPPELPGFLRPDGQDITLTPASIQNPFTGEFDPVRGVMTHATALSNLRHGHHIRRSSVLSIVLSTLALISVVWVTLSSRSIGFNLIWVALIFASYLALTFVFFLGGYLVPWNFGFGATLASFMVVASGRFMMTLGLINRSATMLQAAFSPERVAEMNRTGNAPEARLYRDVVLLVAAIEIVSNEDGGADGHLPSVEHHAHQMTERAASEIVQRFDGGALTYAPGCTIGFWNVPSGQQTAVSKCRDAAVAILEAADGLARRIKRGAETAGVQVRLHVTLHYTDAYLGERAAGSNAEFVLVGAGVDYAVSLCTEAAEELETALIVSDAVTRSVDDQELSIGEPVGGLEHKGKYAGIYSPRRIT